MTAPTRTIADHTTERARLTRMTRRQLLTEARRQGKHRSILHPPLNEWSRDELVALLAPVKAVTA